MSLRLTSDKATPVQAHLDELSIRLGRLLAILVLLMIICWNLIDELIQDHKDQSNLKKIKLSSLFIILNIFVLFTLSLIHI